MIYQVSDDMPTQSFLFDHGIVPSDECGVVGVSVSTCWEPLSCVSSDEFWQTLIIGSATLNAVAGLFVLFVW